MTSLSIDLCDTRRCKFNGICRVVSGNNTECLCVRDITTVYEAICGTDGHTYSNLDKMMLENCRRMTQTEVLHFGACGRC